jgi:ATP-dependent DNA ligase
MLVPTLKSTETFLAKLSKTAHAVIANTFGVDGEILCVDREGRPQFHTIALLGWGTCFFAFDL